MIDKYLESLINDRNTLADNLVSKGIPGITGNETFTELVPEILNILSGVIEENDVNFYDYDGTIVASYSASDFLNLTAMPDNPTHEGLTSQGWNWTLTDAKTYVTSYGMLDIGQMYITDDGATRVYVSLNDSVLDPYVQIRLKGTVTIDWGDESTPDTLSVTTTSSQNKTIQHIYSTKGNYVISILPSDNETQISFLTTGSSWNNGPTIFYGGATSSNETLNNKYRRAVTKIEIGNRCYLNDYYNYVFGNLPNLETITLPNNMTMDTGSDMELTSSMFSYDRSLKYLVIPNNIIKTASYDIFDNNNFSMTGFSIPKELVRGMLKPPKGTSIKKYILGATPTYFKSSFLENTIVDTAVIPYTGSTLDIGSLFSGANFLKKIYGFVVNSDTNTSIFYNCYSLENIELGNDLTTIGNNFACYCYELVNMVFPSGITSIGSQAFRSCISMKYYDFRQCLQVPTLANTNAFQDIPTDCKIIVPDSLYADWVAATNWSTYADYIIKKTDWDALNE